jgi:organic hydroperoxide reductase OsmC/OhrA
MQPLPHHYRVQASGAPEGPVPVVEGRLRLETNAPPEFGGPEGFWSPESLLVASVADCYVLSFRAVARASRLEWDALDVRVEGVLDRVDGVTRFVAFTIRPQLVLADAEKSALARTVLDKAKRACLVTNSLTAACELVPEVTVRGA